MKTVEVNEISKKYNIYHRRDKEKNISSKSYPLVESDTQNNQEEFWALKNISFSVEEGQRIGIIGRNGSGKSTLLKILSRIISPTNGSAIIRGRVSSLLEVGTGFHPDLTGRENIFLNGAILGMRQSEILERFEKIVDFSETGKFLDTPVKHYSSGMYMRLAFAIAAHLEPDVLIIDEVLAVGDANFQIKCLEKINALSKNGCTVLFVSHNLSAVESLCDKAILLDEGKIVSQGETLSVIEKYFNKANQNTDISLQLRKDRRGNGFIRYTSCLLFDKHKKNTLILLPGEDITIKCLLEITNNKNGLEKATFAVSIDSASGRRISCLYHEENNLNIKNNDNGIEFTISIPNLALAPGNYSIALFCYYNGLESDYISNAVLFKMENYSSDDKLYKIPPIPVKGDVIIPHEFHLSTNKKDIAFTN